MPIVNQSLWDRLRAALDAWQPPRGLALLYVIDERAGRLALTLTAGCGGAIECIFDEVPDDADLERFVQQIPSRLDYIAHDLLRDHTCCRGRLPRAIRVAGRRFEGWAEGYSRSGGRRAC